MTATLALLPPAIVLAAVLGLRWSGLAAAGLALISTLALWASGVFFAPSATQGAHALADAALLTFVVAAMIAPGVLFVEATRRLRSPEALQRAVSALRLPTALAAILVAVGIGVTVESLTGMGVSLLVTVPLLLALVDRRAAIGLALVGMSLMPWGALSISGLVGAKLAGLPIDVFADWVMRMSGLVAVALPLLALWFVPRVRMRDVTIAVGIGLIMFAAVWLATQTIGIELAGVAAGLAAVVALALIAERRGFAAAIAAPGLRPYAVLLAAVVAQKAVIVWLARQGLAPTLSTGRVSFAILASPGVALIVAVLLSARSSLDGALLAATVQRAWRPVASVALFMLTARLLVECGAVTALAQSIAGFGRDGAIVATAMLGAVSGFVTGSGVTGNALFMPSAAATGTGFALLPLFAALQNGAAGHTAMASLPVAAILLAALPNRTAADDRTALTIGLTLVGVHLVLITGAALIWARQVA